MQFLLPSVLLTVFVLLQHSFVLAIGPIIDAINAGGPDHVDSFGIQYRADPLEGRTGIASDYGRRFMIGRVDPNDQILYQTERYGLDTFSYVVKLPRDKDADYVLVLKFSEVYFNAPGQKVFDVTINDHHEVVKEIDIFGKVGRGIAHDEIIPFQVRKGKLRVQEEVSDFNGRLVVSFVKGSYDNPKINAFYVMKGTVRDVPPLQPLEMPGTESDEEEEEDADELLRRNEQNQGADQAGRTLKTPQFASGPKAPNPYDAQEQSSIFLPILIAVACFIPVLLCLCKM